MFTPQNGYGYYQYTPPIQPNIVEKKELRSTALRVGTLLLALIGTMQVIYPLVVVVLMAIGFLPKNALSADMLGVDNTTYMVVYSAVYALAMGLPMIIVLFGKKRIWPLSPAKSVRLDVAFLGIIKIITSYLLTFLEQFGITTPEAPEMMVNSFESYLLNLFTIAVLPAILEEMVFRGCVLRLLRPYGNWFAIIVSAATFGLMHGNLRQIPFAVIVGMVLGWLYVITDNIWIPISVHFINNATSVSMEYLGFSLAENTVGIFYTLLILALAALGIGAGLILILARRRYIRMPSVTTTLATGEKYGTLLKVPTFLIAVLLYVLLTILGM